MSNVLKNRRHRSPLDYYDRAQSINIRITKLVMNEKVVPKKYRYVYSIPIIDICRNLVKNASKYCNLKGEDDEFFTLYRHKIEALLEGINNCSDIFLLLQDMKNQFYIKYDVYESVVGLIVDEKKILIELYEREREKHLNLVAQG